MLRYFYSFAASVIVVAASAQPTGNRYELVKLKEVNTFHDEAAPIISASGKELYFFVANHPENTYGIDGSQDIWMSKLDEQGAWSAPKHMTAPFNQNKLNQVFTALPDGSLFVRGGRGKNSVGFSIVSSGAWKELTVKDFVSMNKGRFWGASLSTDARHMILFFSETTGSIKSDLYTSHQQTDGSWSRPEKMKLSSTTDEFGPFISPDQQTVYFASDRQAQGRQGLIDIYKCTRLDDTWTNWSPPVNVGKPINTSAEDFYFSSDAAGNVFTSRSNSRQDGGNLDVFILVPKNIKIQLDGTVYNSKTKQPLAAAVEVKIKDVKPISLKADPAGKFSTRIPETNSYVISASAPGFFPAEDSFPVPKLNGDTTLTAEIFLSPEAKTLTITGRIFDFKTGSPVDANLEIKHASDQAIAFSPGVLEGKYNQDVPKTGIYLFNVKKEGYLNASDSLNYDNDGITPMNKDIGLQPIEVGVTVRLKNIYFDSDKTTLKPESFVELDKVVTFLKDNSTVEIEIAGHTDSQGSDTYNLNLSQGRSESVVTYLASKGITKKRLVAHGYGEAKPIENNDTDQGRAINRRVEFTVLKM